MPLEFTCFSVTIVIVSVMFIESIFFAPALLVFLAQLTLPIDNPKSFLFCPCSSLFLALFYSGRNKSLHLRHLRKIARVAPFDHPGFLFHSKSATIRVAVPAVLSSFLVLT